MIFRENSNWDNLELLDKRSEVVAGFEIKTSLEMGVQEEVYILIFR